MKFDFSKITSEQLDKLKALCVEFNLIPAPVNPNPIPATPAPVAKFGEVTTKDGAVLKWDGDAPMAVGTALLVIDPANPSAFLPAPDGEVELADGSKITIKDGKVESITPITPPANTPPATPTPAAQIAQMAKQLEEVNEKFSTVSKEKEALDNEIKSIKSETETLKKSLETTTSKLKETLEMFSKVMEAPTATPAEQPKNKILSGIGSKVKS